MDGAAIRIMFVCTANQCRSVLAEAIARRRFTGFPFEIASGGLIDGGRRMPPNGILVAQEMGFDMSSHVSHRVDTRHLGEWDVIITMTREHTRELVAADPELWPRVFTLPQFVSWLDEHPLGRHGILRTWIDTAGSERARSEMIGSSPLDDVPDPVDGPPKEWRRLAEKLSEDIDRVAHHLVSSPDLPRAI